MAGIHLLSCIQPGPVGASRWVSTHGSTMEMSFLECCVPSGLGLELALHLAP